jgi:predicted nucleic acid-binding protein
VTPVSTGTLLFIDASSLFVAAKTPTGGSGYILRVCQLGFLRACTSAVVRQETERNLLVKAPPAALRTHRLQVLTTPVREMSVPAAREVQRYTPVFGKDDHVIASAIAARAEFLITLDRRLINNLLAGVYPLVAVTPKEFLELYFVQHPDYARVRQLTEP